jgi:hypothetical protein
MAAATKWVLVDPIARSRRAAETAPAQKAGSALQTVAFFTNSKQHAAEVEAAMASALKTEHGIEPRFYSKPNASVGATPELLRNIATDCDAAVVGSGD